MSLFRGRQTAQSIGIEPGPNFVAPDMALDAVEPEPAQVERQTWELRRLADHTDLALHFEVDSEGRVRLHEAVLARLLHEAGWERTA